MLFFFFSKAFGTITDKCIAEFRVVFPPSILPGPLARKSMRCHSLGDRVVNCIAQADVESRWNTPQKISHIQLKFSSTQAVDVQDKVHVVKCHKQAKYKDWTPQRKRIRFSEFQWYFPWQLSTHCPDAKSVAKFCKNWAWKTKRSIEQHFRFALTHQRPRPLWDPPPRWTWEESPKKRSCPMVQQRKTFFEQLHAGEN